MSRLTSSDPTKWRDPRPMLSWAGYGCLLTILSLIFAPPLAPILVVPTAICAVVGLVRFRRVKKFLAARGIAVTDED